MQRADSVNRMTQPPTPAELHASGSEDDESEGGSGAGGADETDAAEHSDSGDGGNERGAARNGQEAPHQQHARYDRGQRDANDANNSSAADDGEIDDLPVREQLRTLFHIQELTRSILERLIDRDAQRTHEVEALRLTVRRAITPLSAASRAADLRRNNAFFDAVRRRFLDDFQRQIDLLDQHPPHALLFLGHLLDLPVIHSSGRLE